MEFYGMLVDYQAIIDEVEWEPNPRPDLIADIVPWYYEIAGRVNHDNNPNTPKIPTWQAVLRVPDQISLLSFRDTYSGPNSLVEFTANSLSFLQTLDKSVTIGLEFLSPIHPNVLPHITFADNSFAEFRNVRQSAKDQLFAEHPYIAGFMYHQYSDEGNLPGFETWADNLTQAERDNWILIHCDLQNP